MRARIGFAPLLLALCGCQADGGPGPIARLVDSVFDPSLCGFYARDIKTGKILNSQDNSFFTQGAKALPVPQPRTDIDAEE
jgi:hypothetical protein